MILPHYLSLALSLSTIVSAAPRCRCLYGQGCWPSESSFSELATKLTLPLIHPVPPASACYPSSLAQGNCTEATANYRDGNWRSDQPGALENTNFETFLFANGTLDGCYLNVTLGIPCKQGSIPPLGVDARAVEDVQAAVLFVKENNLRLVVKNTGHDYLGRSAGRGGFMLWTHHLKDMSYSDSFVPDGASAPSNETFKAVTLGAGVQWAEAYSFVNQYGQVLVGGISIGGSVGAAGGWLMGGGHSAIAPTFGLGVDNVLQFTAVLANGTYVTVNSYQHPDLFWALRGGGGGTYAVVTSVSYKTHPTFPLIMSALTVNFTSPAIAQSVVTEFMRLHPTLSDLGWGGYSSFSNANFQALFISPNGTAEDANTVFGPFVGYIGNATGSAPTAATLPYTSYYEWFATFFLSASGSQVGWPVEITSRLLPRAIAEANPAKAARIMLSIEGGVSMNSIAGGAVSRMDASSTGLNPSWRKTLGQVYVTEGWSEGSTAATILQARNRLKKNTDILDRVTTDSGSYLNEGSMYEKDFKKSYFGSHYKQLKAIKKRYDPTSLFVVASGVGSEEWDTTLQCRL